MTIQNVFYFVGILYMVLLFALLVTAGVSLFIIKKKVSLVQKSLKHNVNAMKKIPGDKYRIAEDIGMISAAITGKFQKKTTHNK